MAQLQNIQELLDRGTGTEGSLLIPKKIFETLIEEVNKKLIPRSEAALVFGPGQIPGSSVDVNLEVDNTMDVREVAEGAFIPIDEQDYTNVNLKPKKYGVAIRITTEMMEDSQFPLLERQIRTAGKRFAENENSIIISGALDSAVNTVSGGAAITIANISRGMQYLEDADYAATTMFVGNEVLNDLRNIDTFVEADKVGNREMLEKGFIGVIFGMNVVSVSTNAGMTITSSYIIDKDQAYAIAEKRPLTIEKFDLPSYDMKAASLTHRFTASALKTSAMAKITTS